jgi:hypothetical protein
MLSIGLPWSTTEWENQAAIAKAKASQCYREGNK